MAILFPPFLGIFSKLPIPPTVASKKAYEFGFQIQNFTRFPRIFSYILLFLITVWEGIFFSKNIYIQGLVFKYKEDILQKAGDTRIFWFLGSFLCPDLLTIVHNRVLVVKVVASARPSRFAALEKVNPLLISTHFSLFCCFLD
uniref:Uncharacterized protein n=1 Tax=Solanum tuberosum TaxID=4113 RepID=M1D3F8_SOLTU